MEVPPQVVPPVQPEAMTHVREDYKAPVECEKAYDTPWLDKDNHEVNDISKQAKGKEICYIPRDWVTEKLDQIKSTSSLSVDTCVLPETLKIVENVLSFTIKTHMDKNATMELHFFQDGIVKFNCINPANPSQFSFELIEKPANLTIYPLEGKVTVDANQVSITMPEVQAKVVVKFAPFNAILFSTKNNTDEVLFEMNKNKSLKFDENLSADFTFGTEYVYGLPERATNLLLEDTKADLPYRFYNQDIPDYPVGSKNSIYGTCPIIVGRNKNNSILVTMYWQNTSDTYIDIHKDNGSSNAFWLSERGNLECYFFVSHDNKTHFRSMANVFGHCAMPQYFSLGYHQCRWSYEDQKDILQVNKGFNENEIPYDTITLDIDHTDGCKYFTWNEKLYPDVPAMQKEIFSDGRQIITIADPHIKADDEYYVYREAKEKELYIKNNCNEPYIGNCWPGLSVYLDFLNEETRECWASQYGYDKYKYSTPNMWAWNDMNEPSVFDVPGNHMPLDNIQTFKSKAHPDKVFQVEHREVHNIYGYTQVKATFEGMLKRNEGQNIRTNVLTRAFYAGVQKYSTVWTGDTSSTWEFLKVTVPQMLSMSLCGISSIGGDVGGFTGNPEPELAIRWYQLGTFMPFFRGHSALGTDRREPWLYEKKYSDLIKESIKERYRLLPYIYTAYESHCKTAVPLLRPVWFDQEKVFEESNMQDNGRFMIGDSLLVVPVLEKGVTVLKDALKGLEGRWYDYFGKREMMGDEEMNIGIERIGCFVKGGHIVPTFDIKTSVKSSKDAKESSINLYVALDENDKSKGEMYFDDGETFDFKKGACRRANVEFDKNTLTWNSEETGFEVKNKVTKVVITGSSEKFQNAYLVEDGQKQQKVQLTKGSGYLVLEFVTNAGNNWKIVLE
jgi:alpha 1,3-glucosidase